MLKIKALIKRHLKYKEKILYLIFGFLTTVVYLGAYKVFLDIGIQYVLSTNIAFIVAVLFAFVTNRHFVFQKGDNIIREFFLFFGARILTQIINVFGLVFMVEILNIGEFISQVFLMVIVIILNYIFSKYAIFIKKKG